MLRLKEIRKEKGLTLEELAIKSGISVRMISAYEARTSDITYIKMQQLADAMGVTILELTTEWLSSSTPAVKEVVKPDFSLAKQAKQQDEILSLYKKQIQLLEEHSRILLKGQDDLRAIADDLRDNNMLLEEKVMDLTAKLTHYEASATGAARSA